MSDQTIKPLALEDLAPAVVHVRIVTDYGRELVVPIGTLTWHEWNEIGAQVSEPNADDPRFKTRWNEAKKQKEFDPQNEDYLKAREYTIEQRNYRRLLRAMEKGGNDVRRGDTIEEQVDNFIRGVSIEIAGVLIRKLGELSVKGQAGVITLADSFRGGRVPADEGADMPAAGLDADGVG